MDKIIELAKIKKDDDKVFNVIDGKRCKHLAMDVYAQDRKIKCRNCQEEINAFDALLIIADSESEQRKTIDKQRNKIDSIKSIYSALFKKLREMSRFKCRHCGKYNEANPIVGYGDVISGIRFLKVTKDGEKTY